ncbi:hypothetical protein QUF75_15315 [Desulfococcaceae bacterium HSG7]|nr:hypothetical protein [Desulfococcaceae bacterium HSG7]
MKTLENWCDQYQCKGIDNSDRKRLNILGAYNPATRSFIHLTEEANYDAVRAIEFFDHILKAYPHTLKLPSYWIMQDISMQKW